MPRPTKSDGGDRTNAKADLLAAHTLDLLAQVEALLREVTELQRQALRVREAGTDQADILTAISGRMKGLVAHVDTLRDLLRETQIAVTELRLPFAAQRSTH